MFVNDTEVSGIAEGLDGISPGPRLAAILSTIDVEHLSGQHAIIFIRAQNRQIAHDEARQYRALARVGDLYTQDGPELLEFSSAEIGAALSWTRRRADNEMGVAAALMRFPSLHEALEDGSIDLPKVRTILRGVGHVEDEVARAAVGMVLPEAPGLTTGQIAAQLRELVIEADPEQAGKAYQEGVEARQVWSELAPDGTGTMISTGMEAHDLSAANRNINGMAWKIKNSGDHRNIDQIRSDVFTKLLTGSLSSSSERAQVNLTADLATLAELDDKPGELAGFGPVVSEVARRVARQQQDSTWTYAVTDPESGEVFVGTTSRRPTAEIKRRLHARYPTCVHPGCRMNSTSCDIDHTTDWAQGGLTTLCNLAPLCRYHHRLKHLTAWTYRKLADGGIEWTTQFGLTYLTHPP